MKTDNYSEVSKEDHIIITSHAYDRMKERLGLKRKAATRICRKAYQQGLTSNIKHCQLRNYIAEKECSHNIASGSMRIYGDSVFCFNQNNNDSNIVLVTVYHLPKELQKMHFHFKDVLYAMDKTNQKESE